MISLLPVKFNGHTKKINLKQGQNNSATKIYSQSKTDSVSFGSKLPSKKLTEFSSSIFLNFFKDGKPETLNKKNFMEGLRAFVKKYDINSHHKTYTTAHIESDSAPLLHLISGYNQPDAINFLVKKGANVNAVNSSGFTALDVAAVYNKEKAVAKLLKLGAKASHNNNSISIGSMHQPTALLNSLMNPGLPPNFKVVKMVLKSAPEMINVKGQLQDSPLHVAVLKYDTKGLSEKFGVPEDKIIKEQKKIIALLLKSGADPNIKNAEGKTPLQTIGLEIYGFKNGDEYGLKDVFKKFNIKE